MKRKRNPPHSQKSQNKILSLISTEDGQETNMTETLQVHHGKNETRHDEENPSEAEDDTSEDENVAEMQTNI